MISDIDDYLVGQLEKITLNGESIRVLLDYPEREHGKAIYPCIAIVRQGPRVDLTRIHGGCVVSIPSTKTSSTVFEGDTFTGPVDWTQKPYPVPIIVAYDIVVYATTKSHCNYLFGSIYKVIPPFSGVEVNGQNPYFMWDKVIPFGDTDLPIYGLNFVLNVTDIYIERIEELIIPSVTNIDFQAIAEQQT